MRLEEWFFLLRNPATGNRLISENGGLVDSVTGERFAVRDGIPVFLRRGEVSGRNRKQQAGYNLFSVFYDLLYRFNVLNIRKWLEEIARAMEVRPGGRVLETSVGTGQQLYNLKRHGMEGEFFGNDISYGMLRQCRKNCRKWGIEAGLVQGNAEALPFGDGLFDLVFHVGGFNFFNDKAAALREMVRVARPGANLYLVDETDSIRDRPGILGGLADRFLPERGFFAPPADLIPEGMEGIRTSRLLDGKFWMVGFRKP